MKILHKGFWDEDGIRVRCRCCGGEFIVEDRNDLHIEMFDNILYRDKTMPAYYVICPICKFRQNLGLPVWEEETLYQDHIVYERDDWDERFKYKGDGDDKKEQ